MKVKIQAGAELDLLTDAELRTALRDFNEEIRRGVRFVRRSAVATPNAGNILLADDHMGPQGSMVWSVTRISLVGVNLTDSTELLLYINEISSTSFVAGITARNWAGFDLGQLVLQPLDRLIFSYPFGDAATPIGINVQAVEVPIQLQWQLLG